MQSPELRELTASEPLSLKEEYEMQESWREDEDKLTFIILARSLAKDETAADMITRSDIDLLTMIGDVNIFLKPLEEEMETEAEVEVMIAEPQYRRQGLAASALSALLHYAVRHRIHLQPKSVTGLVEPRKLVLVVRIGQSNVGSISLFQKLGFSVTKDANIFGEIEMRYIADLSKGAARWDEAGVEIHYE